MSQLEIQEAKVRKLLHDRGLELLTGPNSVKLPTIPEGAVPIEMWTLSIVNPRNNEDIPVESLNGEHGLWIEAEKSTKKYLAGNTDA